MTAPTHGLFATVLIYLFNIPTKYSWYVIAGSLLPDIDHEKSFVGKIFFPISHPINKRFGHRHFTHSLLLWIPALIIGNVFLKPLYWISIGSISHLFLDCWTLTGVSLFKPITDKVFVMANKNFRIRVGSRNEFVLMLSLFLITWGSFQVYKMGGFRGILRDVMGNYSMTLEDYESAGLQASYIQGKLRTPEGKILKVKYLIVGEGYGAGHLVLYDEKNDCIIRVPEEGKFLKSKLVKSNYIWNSIKIKEPLVIDKIEGIAFNKASKKWRKLKKGDYVIGIINYKGLVELGR